MPNCKNCGSRITKFDKDRCPICGQINPIDTSSEQTIDITGVIGNSAELNLKKVKTRKKLILLSYTIGFSGAPLFYIGFKKIGFIWLAINVVLMLVPAVIIAIFQPFWLALIIALAVLVFLNAFIGTYFLIRHDFKDAHGELIK